MNIERLVKVLLFLGILVGIFIFPAMIGYLIFGGLTLAMLLIAMAPFILISGLLAKWVCRILFETKK